jgi:hypothetical protein
MDLQEIEVVIESNGEVRLHVRGVKGDACLELTKELEAALGGQIKAREMTAESYETARQEAQQHQQQRGQ